MSCIVLALLVDQEDVNGGIWNEKFLEDLLPPLNFEFIFLLCAEYENHLY